MSEDDTRDAQITVTILGEPLDLILPGMGWTFEEARVGKDVSGGMAPVEIESRLMTGDPDAWFAILRVSYLRARKDFPAEGIEGVDMMELVGAITESVEAYLETIPPTSPSGTGSDDSAETSESEPVAVPDSE